MRHRPQCWTPSWSSSFPGDPGHGSLFGRHPRGRLAPCGWWWFAPPALTSLNWVWWLNNKRLFGPIGHVPPGEHEAEFYARSGADTAGAAVTETRVR